MNRSELKQLLITLLCCALTATGILLWTTRSNKKIAVVDAIQVFNAFKMKAEMEGKASGSLRYLSHQADSLRADLEGKSKLNDFPKAELETLYKQFVEARNTLQSEYQQSTESINEQVWKRLNPLIDEYGKKEGLRLIIGANGMGNVLYNDDYYDHTKAVTEFVNRKYEQGN